MRVNSNPGLAMLAAMFVPISAVFAQNTVSIAGGATIPLGVSADALNTGYNASLALTAKPPLASVGIRLEATFNSFGIKNRSSSTSTSTERIMALTANATLQDPSTPLRSFYLIGGIGAYSTRIEPSQTKANNDVGFNIGVGMNLTTAVGTFVEVRYHHIPSEATTVKLIPITLGLRF